MFTSLILENFKGYGTRTEIPLAPITLLLGANSSGKSTVLQALLALRQSWSRRHDGFSDLETRGPYSSLGRFGNVQHAHDPANNVVLGLRRGDSVTEFTYGTPSPEVAEADGLNRINELCEMVLESGEVGRFEMTPWSFEHDPSTDRSSVRGTYSLDDDRSIERRIHWSRTGRELLVDDEQDKAASLRVLIERTAYRAERWLQGIRHIGPSRIAGQRAYERDSSGNDEVGAWGQNLATSLSRAESRLDVLNERLVRVGVPYALSVRDLDTLGDTVEILLEDLRHRRPDGRPIRVGISDVGFGVGQLIPVLVEWHAMEERRLDTRAGGTLLVEQPELHLHPAWQVELVHEFARPVAARHRADGGSTLLNQVLLETHSPVIVRTLQRLVRCKILPAADVAILHVESGVDGTRVKRIGIDSDGTFDSDWPEGFFPQEEDLLFDDIAELGD